MNPFGPMFEGIFVGLFDVCEVGTIALDIVEADTPIAEKYPLGCSIGVIDTIVYELAFGKEGAELAGFKLVIVFFALGATADDTRLTDRAALDVLNMTVQRHTFQISTGLAIFTTVSDVFGVFLGTLME